MSDQRKPLVDLLAYNVGQDDPHDHYPWKWEPNMDDPKLGAISTPNGRRPDGAMHTFWGIAHNIWEPNGRLICALVNRWAHEQFGTPLGDPIPRPPRTGTLGLSEEDTRAMADRFRSDYNGVADRAHNAAIDMCAADVARWDAEDEAARNAVPDTLTVTLPIELVRRAAKWLYPDIGNACHAALDAAGLA